MDKAVYQFLDSFRETVTIALIDQPEVVVERGRLMGMGSKVINTVFIVIQLA